MPPLVFFGFGRRCRAAWLLDLGDLDLFLDLGPWCVVVGLAFRRCRALGALVVPSFVGLVFGFVVGCFGPVLCVWPRLGRFLGSITLYFFTLLSVRYLMWSRSLVDS